MKKGPVEDTWESVWFEAAIKTIIERICWNPLWKKEIVSWKLNILNHSSRSSSGMTYTRAHLSSKGHLLTPHLKDIRRTRTKRSLQWHVENGHKNILFRGGEMFTIQEEFNKQNYKIYGQASLQVHYENAESHHPTHVMVWWSVSHQGWHLFIFVRKLWKLMPTSIKRLCYKEL